jgi:hypothetical protein
VTDDFTKRFQNAQAEFQNRVQPAAPDLKKVGYDVALNHIDKIKDRLVEAAKTGSVLAYEIPAVGQVEHAAARDKVQELLGARFTG